MRRIKAEGNNLRQIWEGIHNLQPDAENDDDAMFRLKQVINDPTKISKHDRELFLIYAEVGSLQTVANLMAPEFRVSKSTIRSEIARIRREIIKNL